MNRRIVVPLALVGNALVQAVTVLPTLTPAASPLFALLAVVSAAAIIVTTVLVTSALVTAFAQSTHSTHSTPLRVPARLWLVTALSIAVIGILAVVALPSLLLTVPVTFVLLPGAAAGRPLAGFRAFAASPGKAIGLAVLSIAALALLWVGALLSGFLVTGAVSAAVTWLVFGVVGALFIRGWATLLDTAHP